jgi:hypothetical protein
MQKIVEMDPDEDPFDALISQAMWQANAIKNGSFFDAKNSQEEYMKSQGLPPPPSKSSAGLLINLP